MSTDDLMAVVAPDTSSAPSLQATHAPDVKPSPPPKSSAPNGSHAPNGPNGSNGTGAIGKVPKRVVESDSDSDEKPLAKKPKARGSIGGAGAGKKRRIVDSDSEDEEMSSPAAPTKQEPKSQPTPATNGSSSTSKPAAATKPKSKPLPASSDLSSDSESDAPLAKKTSAPKPQTNGKPRASTSSKKKVSSTQSSSSSEEERPLAKRQPAKKVNYNDDEESEELSSEESDSEDDKPLAKKKATPKVAEKKGRVSNGSAKVNGSAKKDVKVKKEVVSSDEDDVPLAKKSNGVGKKDKGKGKETGKKDEKVQVKKEKKVKKEDDEEDDGYKWWEQGNNDDSIKWTTLQHNGVLFPPPYVPLPKGVKMKYDGVSLTLPPETEEVAGFWAAMLETDHVQDKTFQDNFFRDFKATLKDFPPKENVKVEKLEKCDFRPMFEHFEREKEKKKAMTKDEKKQIKEDKDKLEAPYLFATVDGRKEKLGNFRAEPPGLFRGRGEHPRKGTLKNRLKPEDITINIAADAVIPVPNVPGQWKAVKHDPTVTWLAEWKENVNGNTKYVFLSAGSSWKGQSDRQKFEKARELIKHVDRIRKQYQEDLRSKQMSERQRATAIYFIDKLALRAGNEKGEEEADTVGCCSLRYEHVILEPPNLVTFDFLGKDSMRFHQTVEVEPQVFKNIKIFKQDKGKLDQLFDRLSTTGLNKFLNDQMPGLTAKVFRTYNASWTFQIQLKNTPKNGSIQEKISAYNTANRDVAILCNHQKTVSKNFAESFAKMGDKIRALKYQRMKLRYQLISLEPKIKKKHPEIAEDESDMDDDFFERHEADLLEKALEAAKKRFEKDNIKLEEAKEDVKPKVDLDERLKEIKKEFKELAKERKSKKVEPRKGATEERLLEQIAKMDDRIAAAKVAMGDRDKTKDVALGTSKINYIDPRLTVAWAKKYDVPLEKLFSKTLREKFPWAEAEADADWVF